MSFTTPILIKKHLLTSTFPALVTRNYPVAFDGTTPVELPHHNLVEGSEAVKWNVCAVPHLDLSITFKGEDFFSMEHEQLVFGTVLVTLSEALTTIYVEGLDYEVDHENGRICRAASGSIPDEQPVLIYYSYYSLFIPVTDYTLDAANGILARTEDSAIPDGATVFVDYTVTEGTVDDDLIAQAIVEAEDIILRFLSPDYNANSTDQGLKTGATELALSIFCRAEAMEALTRRATSDGSGRAKEWQQLSRFYEDQAWQTLAPFLLPMHLRSTVRQSRETN